MYWCNTVKYSHSSFGGKTSEWLILISCDLLLSVLLFILLFLHTFTVHPILPRICKISHLHPLMSVPICRALSKTLSFVSLLQIFDAHHGFNGRGCYSLYSYSYPNLFSQVLLITLNALGLVSFSALFRFWIFLAANIKKKRDLSQARLPWHSYKYGFD